MLKSCRRNGLRAAADSGAPIVAPLPLKPPPPPPPLLTARIAAPGAAAAPPPLRDAADAGGNARTAAGRRPDLPAFLESNGPVLAPRGARPVRRPPERPLKGREATPVVVSKQQLLLLPAGQNCIVQRDLTRLPGT